MKLLLFLGSGVSSGCGLPNTQEISCALFRDGIGSTLPRFGVINRHTRHIPKRQALLRILREHAIRYGRSSRSDNAHSHTDRITYEMLFYLSQQLANQLNEEADNPAIGGFVEEILEQAKNQKLPGQYQHPFEGESEAEYSQYLREQDPPTMGILAEETCNYIQWVVWHELNRTVPLEELERKLALVLDLARSDEIDQLDICTLNHDLLLETLFDSKGIQYIDGFGPPDGNIRFFKPAVYDEKTTKGIHRIRIFKLHGSINWRFFQCCASADSRPAIHMVGQQNSSEYCDALGRIWQPLEHQHLLLAGTGNKTDAYNRQRVFVEMWHRFHHVLEEHDRIVMSGYGWGDIPVNDKLRGWIDANSKKNKLFLLHRCFDHTALFPADSYVWEVIDKRLVVIKKWLSDVCTLEDLLREIGGST